MNTEKLKEFVDRANEDERIYLSVYLRHKLRGRSPAAKLDLEERMKEMDEGRKVPLRQAWEMHAALEKQGL
jgi:hypothetical protein